MAPIHLNGYLNVTITIFLSRSIKIDITVFYDICLYRFVFLYTFIYYYNQVTDRTHKIVLTNSLTAMGSRIFYR